MNLPIALVERFPREDYLNQYKTKEASLKAITSDALKLHYEIIDLKKTFIDCTDKVSRSHNKQLNLKLREKEEQLFRLIKFSDYPAMIMAAYPNSIFLDYDRFNEEKENLPKNYSVLLRGISSGKIADYVRSIGNNYYFIETGYLGNYPSDNNKTGRKVYHRIVKNLMQHREVMDVPDDRFKELVKFDPKLEYKGWKNPGSKILIVSPSEKPCKYYGINKDQWVSDTIKEIKKYSDKEIVVREKASRGERTNSTIYEALDNDIFAVVTYNSIAAIEAVGYGIPAFALAPTAAEKMCLNDLSKIESPYYPAEDLVYKWLSSIAYSQFTLTEILTGEAWKLVVENETRPTISC